jgi:hypothetical protein
VEDEVKDVTIWTGRKNIYLVLYCWNKERGWKEVEELGQLLRSSREPGSEHAKKFLLFSIRVEEPQEIQFIKQ